jgi:hypothetical protein
MIMNIKIHNIINIIGFSKSMKPNKFIHKLFFYENIHLSVFDESMVRFFKSAI